MLPLLLCLSMTLSAADETPPAERRSTPVAPSLRGLTRAEADAIEDTLDRFIRADTGRLTGAAGRQAMLDFDKLGPEAVPAMIRALNRVSQIDHSCPVLMISKKLSSMLGSTMDEKLLEYARDEIGAGLGRTTHGRVLADLRTKCMLRRNALLNRPSIGPGGVEKMTVPDLVRAVGRGVRGEQLQGVLGELAKRGGRDGLTGIVAAANSVDGPSKKLGREALDGWFTIQAKESLSVIREKLGDSRAEVAMGAIREAIKHDELVLTLIERVSDDRASVRAEARRVLAEKAKTEDFGPEPRATKAQREEAVRKWREWWNKRGG